MGSNKIVKILFISFAICITIGLFLGAGVWIYKSQSSTGQVSDDYYYGGVGLVTPDIDRESYESATSNGDYAKDASSDPSIIRTGEISVSVDDIDATVDEVNKIKDDFGGDITNSYDNGKGKDRTVHITVKVNEDDFDDVYAKLREIEGEYVYSSINASDVTETVMDLEARLKNYESVEVQLLEILKSAETVTDTLAVYKELNEVRYNIENVETQLTYYENQTDYSTISLYITQSSTGSAITDDEWKPLGVLKDASRALVDFAKFIGSALIWVVVFVPVIALIVVPIVIIQKRSQK